LEHKLFSKKNKHPEQKCAAFLITIFFIETLYAKNAVDGAGGMNLMQMIRL
jgi:hypothetical protein